VTADSSSSRPPAPAPSRSAAGRTLAFRGLAALLVFAVLDVVLAITHFAPDAFRLALLVLVCAAGVSLLFDSAHDEAAAPWPDHDSRPVLPPGADPRMAAYVRLIEDHLTARAPDRALPDRLVELSGGSLAGELAGDLAGEPRPPRRLTRHQIEDYLRRIEEQ
jgi:hypothetical protein